MGLGSGDLIKSYQKPIHNPDCVFEVQKCCGVVQRLRDSVTLNRLASARCIHNVTVIQGLFYTKFVGICKEKWGNGIFF